MSQSLSIPGNTWHKQLREREREREREKAWGHSGQLVLEIHKG